VVLVAVGAADLAGLDLPKPGDVMGRVTATETSTSNPDPLTSATYDWGGRCISATNEINDFTTTFTYDLLGRQTEAGVDAEHRSHFTYNTLGWKLKIEDADGFTSTYTYDQVGRVTSDTTAGHVTAYSYDSAGLLLTKTESAESRTTSFTYDYFARASSETQVVASATVKDLDVTYDSLGRVVTSSDTVRNLTHHFDYADEGDDPLITTDVMGVGTGTNLVSTTLTIGADGLESSRASQIAGSPPVSDVTRTVDARDDAKRLTQATLNTGSANIYAQYEYDSAGHLERQWG
jgi:YD repeat-containing protein